MQSIETGYIKLYVYIVESLSTSIREYKTLRCSEFYGLCDTIIHPEKALPLQLTSEEAVEPAKVHKTYKEMEKYLKFHG